MEILKDEEALLSMMYTAEDGYFAFRMCESNGIIDRGCKKDEVKETIVIAHTQDTLQSEEVGIMLFNGETVIKRYINCNGKVLLVEPGTEPISVGENDKLIVCGKVVESRITLY